MANAVLVFQLLRVDREKLACYHLSHVHSATHVSTLRVQGYVACLARFSMQADSAVGQRRARGFDCDSVPLIPPNSHHRLHSMHAAVFL
jgi:hypothetical protein